MSSGKGLEMHYVIGDVHGCFDELMALLDRIESNDKDARFCFVGDFPDRGPKVKETLDWMVTHVTETGKYQSVMGNHEQLAIDWYYGEFLPWCENPGYGDEPKKSSFDFSEVMREQYDYDETKIRTIIDTFSRFPYSKRIEVGLSNGKTVPYRICHASFRDNIDPEDQVEINLWDRDFWGRGSVDEIMVCGHTPTFVEDFNLRGGGQDMPGFICYRSNMINIDCGCCFRDYNDGMTFLAAICLETMEEYYHASAADRVLEYAASDAAAPRRKSMIKLMRSFKGADPGNTVSLEEGAAGILAGSLLEMYKENHGTALSSGGYREMILRQFGFPDDIPVSPVRIW